MLTEKELETIEMILEDSVPEDGWTETAINDIFWHDKEWVCEMLGCEIDEVYARSHERKKKV
jgi:hypothetical protein